MALGLGDLRILQTSGRSGPQASEELGIPGEGGRGWSSRALAF